MDVLQAAVGVVGWSEAEEGFEFRIPRLRDVSHFQGPVEQASFDGETQENVQVVSGFVSLDADWGISGTINSGEEFIERDFAKMVK